MNQFKEGDLVILIQAFPRYRYSIGFIYEIESYSYYDNFYIIYNPDDPCHAIESVHGEWHAPASALKLYKPPEAASTWEKIQELTDWNPTKETVEIER